MVSGRLQSAKRGPKEGSKRGPKRAPTGNSERTWLIDPSRTLPGPCRDPPGANFPQMALQTSFQKVRKGLEPGPFSNPGQTHAQRAAPYELSKNGFPDTVSEST